MKELHRELALPHSLLLVHRFIVGWNLLGMMVLDPSQPFKKFCPS